MPQVDQLGQPYAQALKDGLRVTFENLGLIHFRPSGNAPALRCYNEAASEQAALELNEICL